MASRKRRPRCIVIAGPKTEPARQLLRANFSRTKRYLAHNHGEMPREIRGAAVQGHNVRLASLVTMGECWHNNHHAFPGSARLGLTPDEWDPGWCVLRGLEHLGLVWALRRVGGLRIFSSPPRSS